MTCYPKISDLARELLVRLLARACGLFVPFRDPQNIAWSHIHDGIAAFRETGGAVSWASSSADNAGAKAAERALRELEDAKLVVRLKLKGVGQRTSDVLLSEAGYAAAGAWVGDHWQRSALWATERTAAFSTELTARPDAFVAEVEFSEPRGVGWGDGKSAEVYLTQDVHLPALVLGYLAFNSTIRGHGAYKATEAGLAAIEAATEEELSYIEPPPADKALLAIYHAELSNAVATWRNKSERTQSIGEIPLSASGGPDLFGFAMSKREEITT